MSRRHFHPTAHAREVTRIKGERNSLTVIPRQEAKYKESEAAEIYRHVKEFTRLTSWQRLDGLTFPILNLVIQAKIPFEVGDFGKKFGTDEWVYAALIKGEHAQGIKIFEQETNRTPIFYRWTWGEETNTERVYIGWEKRFSYEDNATIELEVNSFNHEKGYVNCHVSVFRRPDIYGRLEKESGPFRLKLTGDDFGNYDALVEKLKATVAAKSKGVKDETAKTIE